MTQLWCNIPLTSCNKIEDGQTRVLPLKCMFHHYTPELILRWEVLDLPISELSHECRLSGAVRAEYTVTATTDEA